ncbi:hypothetical protein B566_EDAN002089 [Ephemera danica]|nr:hypothetical protein B566_EDAN002089 [Ephemera danica]
MDLTDSSTDQEPLEAEKNMAKPKYKFIWSEEANEQFIHMRKKYDFMFTGAKNASQHGWAEVLNKLELSEHVTSQQAKKRWENLVHRYKELSRSKPAGTITWKYYNLMDWAYGNKETCDDDSNEEEEQGQFIAEETDSSQDKFSVMRLAENGQMEVVLPTSVTSAQHEETSSGRSLLLTRQPFPRSLQSPAPISHAAMSVQSAAATLLDLAEQRQVDAIISVKSSLDELVALQHQTLESQYAQQQAMERLAEASERQAAAMERLAELASQRHVMQENATFL